jgi:hypothetical protein
LPYAFCNNNPVNFVDPDGEACGKAAKVVKKVCKAAKAGNKVSVKGILKSEALDIADNLRTLFDSDASGFEIRKTVTNYCYIFLQVIPSLRILNSQPQYCWL